LIEARERPAGHRLRYVDLPLSTAELADRLHPNDRGYEQMAGIFAGALDRAVSDGWVRPRPYTDPDRVRLADFDGDGRADYLLFDEHGGVWAWLNCGGGGSGGTAGWAARGRVAAGIT